MIELDRKEMMMNKSIRKTKVEIGWLVGLQIVKIREAYINKYILNGYQKKGRAVVKKYPGKRYSVQQYQGEHEGEYTVMEVDENGVENGKA